MTKDNKFCPNCGEKLEASVKFCPKCAYNFEEKTAPVAQVTDTPQTHTQTKSGEGIQGLLKRKEVQIGLVVAAILALAYFLIGGLDIAGTYISDEGDTVKISRNGKVTAKQENYGETMQFVFHVKQSEYDDSYYQAVLEKGLEIEMTMPQDSMGTSDLEEFNMFASMLGLNIKETKGSIVISGKLQAETASLMDLDFFDFDIEYDEDENGIYIQRDYFQKQ